MNDGTSYTCPRCGLSVRVFVAIRAAPACIENATIRAIRARATTHGPGLYRKRTPCKARGTIPMTEHLQPYKT